MLGNNIGRSSDSLEEQFAEVLEQIQRAKRKAFQQVNNVLVELYWNIGGFVFTRVNQAGWGKSTVEELAAFIKRNDPGMKGFSARNIWTMKQFYETYSSYEKLPSLMAELSWTQNRRIMSLKTVEEREFYALLCQQQNYSVRELERLINSGTFERTMLADQNASEAVKQLPQSTQGIFKDRYIFEFLDLPTPHREKDLRHALVARLKDFILELGVGFTFVGEEYRLQVGTEDF